MVSDVLHIMSDLCSTGVSQVLRERGEATWIAAISHPMVRQIGDGTLPVLGHGLRDVSPRGRVI